MRIINLLKLTRLNAIKLIFRLLPIKQNRIICWANSFKQYGCSPKAITEYLLANYPGKFDIVWVFEQGVRIPKSFPNGVRAVRYFSLDYLKEIHTSHFVICNMRTGNAYMWDKRRGQRYIQTWHSSIRLKKIEKDAENTLPKSYIENAKKDSSKIDVLISGCEFSKKVFENSFWYNGEILKTGTPRCDIFFSDVKAVRAKVCQALNLNPKSKILLYAPTFRNGNNASLHNLDFDAVKQALTDTFGGEWAVVYRFHPNIIKSYSIDQDGVDATRYPDMQELIATADILVTDYSSCMFDMAIAGKPCILYTPDLSNYIAKERGLYFEFKELPFPIALSNNELLTAIQAFDADIYASDVSHFLQKVGSYECGKASERIASYILDNIK